MNIMEIEEAKLRDLQQKAKVKWIKDGDDNTKFFHGSIKQNIRSSRIQGLSVNGEWCNDPGRVKVAFFEHFSNRFCETNTDRPLFSSGHFKQLSGPQAMELIADFSMEEIKCAVWDCGGDKSPGPDGFSFNFIKKFWFLLAGDVKKVLDYYHAGGVISIGCNAAFIALIPKVNDPELVAEYRPISLIGCLYKIYSKVLANRLKKVIHFVVGPEQSAFIEGRNILEGPLMVNETIGWLKKK